MNDQLCRVDEMGVWCVEHKQFLKDCAHHLQKVCVMQRTIVKNLKGMDDHLAQTHRVLNEAGLNIRELSKALEVEQKLRADALVALEAAKTECTELKQINEALSADYLYVEKQKNAMSELLKVTL